jgi:hypothetical protein
MRAVTFLLTASFMLAAGVASACPSQNVSRDQTLASANSGPSTPIPAKSAPGGNG